MPSSWALTASTWLWLASGFMNTDSSTPPFQRAVCLLTAWRVMRAAPVRPSEMTTTSIEAIVISRLRRRLVAVSLTTYPPEIAIR